MNQKLIKTIELENDLILNLYDESKKMVGDRWLVTLTARIKIPVDDALIQEQRLSQPQQEEIKNKLGSEIVFEQKRNRIFIDKNDKKSVFRELYDNFIESTLHYLSHKDFPERFLLKKIKEALGPQKRPV